MQSGLAPGASSSAISWVLHAISRAAVGPGTHAGRGFRGRGLRPSLCRALLAQRRALVSPGGTLRVPAAKRLSVALKFRVVCDKSGAFRKMRYPLEIGCAKIAAVETVH